MKNLNETINTAVATEIEKLLKRVKTPATVWDVYFCVLEDLQREFPMLKQWRLRSSLAIQILEKHLTEGEEEQTMLAIYDHTNKELQAECNASIRYTWGEIEGITNC